MPIRCVAIGCLTVSRMNCAAAPPLPPALVRPELAPDQMRYDPGVSYIFVHTSHHAAMVMPSWCTYTKKCYQDLCFEL